MKNYKYIAIATIITFLFIGIAETSIAQTQQQQQHRPLTKNFGIGAMLGEPSGVTVKVWTGNTSAFDIGGAWSLANKDQALHLHASWLFHNWLENTTRLAWYYGIGGRVIFDDDPAAGVRVPVGLTYVMRRLPLDLFVEVAPILDLTPDTGFAGNGAFGGRIYF